ARLDEPTAQRRQGLAAGNAGRQGFLRTLEVGTGEWIYADQLHHAPAHADVAFHYGRIHRLRAAAQSRVGEELCIKSLIEAPRPTGDELRRRPVDGPHRQLECAA